MSSIIAKIMSYSVNPNVTFESICLYFIKILDEFIEM